MNDRAGEKDAGETKSPREGLLGGIEVPTLDRVSTDQDDGGKSAAVTDAQTIEPEVAAETSALRDVKRRAAAGEERMFFYTLLYRLAGALSPLMNVISSLSVKNKIAGALIIVLLLTVLSLGIMTFSRQKDLLEQEIKSRSQILVQQVANVGKEGLLTKQDLPVFSMISDFQKNTGVAYAMVIDAQGNIFAHSHQNQKGMLLTDAASLRSLRADSLLFQQTEYEGEPVMDATLPIIYKTKNLRIGTARVGISMKSLNAAIHHQVLLFLWISLAFMGMGLAISFGLAKYLTRPILTLAEGMLNVARGDVSLLLKVLHKDEIGKLTEAFNQMTLSLREKLHMEKYLSGSAVRSIRLHRDTVHLRLGGENTYVTALFSDVRGFTSMSEKMTPEEVVNLLNIYLNLQAKVIDEWGGVVDKFVGDEVMAIFEGRGNEINAVRAAMQIQRYCRALNEARTAAGEKGLHVGIGLNSGDAVMGNMGSENHMDYTVVGDTINTASRICSVARADQIVISKTTANELGSLSTLRILEPVLLKGKDKPTEIQEVLDVQGATRQEMRQTLNVMVEYHLAGLSDSKGTAIAKDISSWGCLLEMTAPIGLGSRLTMTINLQSLGIITVEAMVHHTRKTNGTYQVGLHFIDFSDASRYRIEEWVHQVESEVAERTTRTGTF